MFGRNGLLSAADLDTGREIGVSGSCHGELGDLPSESTDDEIVDSEAVRESPGGEITKFDSSCPKASSPGRSRNKVGGGGRGNLALLSLEGIFWARSWLDTLRGEGLLVFTESRLWGDGKRVGDLRSTGETADLCPILATFSPSVICRLLPLGLPRDEGKCSFPAMTLALGGGCSIHLVSALLFGPLTMGG